MTVKTMETVSHQPPEAEPPATPPPLESYPQPPIIPRFENVTEEEEDEGRQISPDKLAWSATHRQESIDRNVERHARKLENAFEENEPVEAQYEQRAEKRADTGSAGGPADEPKTTASVGEIARQSSEEYSMPQQPQVPAPQQPAADYYQQTPISQEDYSGQIGDDTKSKNKMEELLQNEMFKVYRKYILAGFFFGLVALVAMLLIWLVIG